MRVIQMGWSRLVALVWHRLRFKRFGERSFIIQPLQIVNPKYISVGNRVRIRHHLRMEALDVLRTPSLTIGDNCNIEQNVHIVCSSSVTIGRNCSLTARCAVVDTWHPYTHIGVDAKIGEALNQEPAFVDIGDGCFLGIGSVILPNVRLGRRCVVGANAVVVAGSYPDGAILAGAPARIVKLVPPEQF